MRNQDRYLYGDFTLANYESLLKLALGQGYAFGDYSLERVSNQREIVWRHDVEFSVHRALKMARIEQASGVRAHYFVQLHSEFYNAFEKEIFLLLADIVGLGHRVGLHFDAHFWEVRYQRQLEECLAKDAKTLEDLLGVRIKSFSFHNTTPALLAMNETHYAGLLNVYAGKIRKKYRYCTDSTGIWRYERLRDVLNDPSIQYLQVLTHDGMWQDEPMAPRQRVLRCIRGRAVRTVAWYDRCLKDLGQLNIDECNDKEES